MFICINSANEGRKFETLADAKRFAVRQGDMSKLWDIRQVVDGKLVRV